MASEFGERLLEPARALRCPCLDQTAQLSTGCGPHSRGLRIMEAADNQVDRLTANRPHPLRVHAQAVLGALMPATVRPPATGGIGDSPYLGQFASLTYGHASSVRRSKRVALEKASSDLPSQPPSRSTAQQRAAGMAAGLRSDSLRARLRSQSLWSVWNFSPGLSRWFAATRARTVRTRKCRKVVRRDGIRRGRRPGLYVLDSPGAAVRLVRDVLLRDGSTLRLQAPGREDYEDIRAFYERLSSRSRYFRFHGMGRPDVVAHAAVESGGVDRVSVIARHGGRVIAACGYERLREPDVAEIALAVADDEQGRGIGTRMLE